MKTKFEDLIPGRTVYAVGKGARLNTPINRLSVWEVRIVSTDPVTQTVRALWNSPKPREFTHVTWKTWHLERPKLIEVGPGKMKIASPASDAVQAA